MQDKILSVISGVTKISEQDLKSGLDVPNLWDSFSHIELIVNLEGTFDVSFDQSEIAAMKTPQKVIDAVMKKVGT